MFRRGAFRNYRFWRKPEMDSTVEPTADELKEVIQKINMMNWTRAFIPVLPSVVFGVFTIIFSMQQNAFFHRTREHDQ